MGEESRRGSDDFAERPEVRPIKLDVEAEQGDGEKQPRPPSRHDLS